MYSAEYDGVLFVEGIPPSATHIRPIESELLGFISQSQLKTLDDVKSAMASEVKSAGGNAVINFTYGQRSSFWKSLLSIDDVIWHGTGVIARVD